MVIDRKPVYVRKLSHIVQYRSPIRKQQQMAKQFLEKMCVMDNM